MANISDIQQKARNLVDADSTSLTNANLLIEINQAYEEVVSLILNCDGLWTFDDLNYTDFPIGRTTLVNGQQDYTFDSSHLEIEGVSVLNSSGDFIKLTPIDKSQMGVDPTEFMPDSGMPVHYDKEGRSILLYPAPSSSQTTLANGLKVFFKRTADLFTSAQVTTGTKQPGFASPFHMILAYKAVVTYAMTYKKDRVAMIQLRIKEMEDGIKKHYGRREQDRRKILMPSGTSYM